jgi:hypothetical protein
MLWSYQLYIMSNVENQLSTIENASGLSGVILTSIIGITTGLVWFARRQHAITLSVLLPE